ncbi:GNAT family N-acetyltransferase [Streptomyces sp. NPDC003691]
MRHWPLIALKLTTADLVLRLPSDDEFDSLAQVAADGVVPDAPCTSRSPGRPHRRPSGPGASCRTTGGRGATGPARIGAFSWPSSTAARPSASRTFPRDFVTTGEARTGFRLGRRFQGQGYGTQMRAAALALAFDGLGAARVTSTAFADNAASRAVSRKFGYRPNGVHRVAVSGLPYHIYEEVIEAPDWRSCAGRQPVGIAGLDGCIPFFR